MSTRRFYFPYIFYITVVFVLVYIVLYSMSETNLIIYWPEGNGKKDCYGKEEDDALQSVDDPSFSPKSQSIFFHETSCRGGIDSRQACAVESAARAHPDWDVYLMFSGPVYHAMLRRSCLSKLLQYPNIKMARIHPITFANHTAVSKLVRRGMNSWRASQVTSSVMKILTLKKWGGVNLDLDVLVLKSFLHDYPNNWIAKEYADIFAGIYGLSKDEVGQNFTRNVLQEMYWSTEADDYPLFDAELAIDHALVKRCGVSAYSTHDCKDIFIFDPDMFFTNTTNQPLFPLEQSEYIFYKWKTTKLSSAVYGKIAKQVCPKIYRMYGEEFGVL